MRSIETEGAAQGVVSTQPPHSPSQRGSQESACGGSPFSSPTQRGRKSCDSSFTTARSRWDAPPHIPFATIPASTFSGVIG